MKIIKSKYRSTMIDDHFKACLRLATRTYCLYYETLADSIQFKSSELDGDHKCIQLYFAIRVHEVMQGTRTYILYI